MYLDFLEKSPVKINVFAFKEKSKTFLNHSTTLKRLKARKLGESRCQFQPRRIQHTYKRNMKLLQCIPNLSLVMTFKLTVLPSFISIKLIINIPRLPLCLIIKYAASSVTDGVGQKTHCFLTFH